MRQLLILLAAALLGGCGGEPAKKPRMTRAERQEAAQAQLSKTPIPRTYRYADAELRVFQVPVPDGIGYVDQQTCMVWRDLEFKTSTISCSVPPEMAPLSMD